MKKMPPRKSIHRFAGILRYKSLRSATESGRSLMQRAEYQACMTDLYRKILYNIRCTFIPVKNNSDDCTTSAHVRQHAHLHEKIGWLPQTAMRLCLSFAISFDCITLHVSKLA